MESHAHYKESPPDSAEMDNLTASLAALGIKGPGDIIKRGTQSDDAVLDSTFETKPREPSQPKASQTKPHDQGLQGATSTPPRYKGMYVI